MRQGQVVAEGDRQRGTGGRNRGGREAVDRALSAGIAIGLSSRKTRERITETLAAIAAAVVEAGIPLATIEGGTVAGTALITKAGAFGGTETVVNCLDRLREV